MASEVNDPQSEPNDAPKAPDEPSIPMSLIDSIGHERAHELMREAVREGIARQHAAGLPTAHGDGNGRVYLLYPDGSRTYLDESSMEE